MEKLWRLCSAVSVEVGCVARVIAFMRRLMGLGILCVLVVACGQRGPLYLPQVTDDSVLKQDQIEQQAKDKETDKRNTR